MKKNYSLLLLSGLMLLGAQNAWGTFYFRSTIDSWVSATAMEETTTGSNIWYHTIENATGTWVEFQITPYNDKWDNQIGADAENVPVTLEVKCTGNTSAHKNICLAINAGDDYVIKYDATNNKYWVESEDASTIYFYNNLTWGAVYANIYPSSLVFTDSQIGNQIANRNYTMTKVGETNYWMVKYTGTCEAVAFTSNSQPNYEKFYETGVVCVDNANSKNLFVPNSTSDYYTNKCYYYKNGLWLDYGTTSYVRTEGVTDTYFGTICLPFASSSFSGMNVYTVAGKVGTGIGLTPLVGQMVAGTPYVFEATGNTITVNYTGDPTANAVATTYLVGNLSGAEMDVPENSYILTTEGLRKVGSGASAKIANYRAYFDLSSAGLAPANPNMRIIEILDETTDIESINAEDVTIKVVENGKLYIKRNGVVYDMTGRIVK